MTPSREGTLRIGAEVLWRGSWGSDAPLAARVTGIERTGGGKYGEPVSEAPWVDVVGRNYCVDLDNGHWAYADQIDPAPAPDFDPTNPTTEHR